MSIDENKALVERMVAEVFNRHDVEALDRFIAADFIDHDPLPGQGPGLAGVKEKFARIFGAFPDAAFKVQQYIAEADYVAWVFVAEGTHTGDTLGFPATGKHLAWTELNAVRIAAGKMVEHWGMPDRLALRRELGASTRPSPREGVRDLIERERKA